MKKRMFCMLLVLMMIGSLVFSVSADEYDDLRQEMRDSFLTEEMLDISQYELDIEQLQEIYDKLYHSGQLPWYADEDCDYVFGGGLTVQKFRPKVLNPKVYDRDLYEQKMAELIAETCQSWMSDWQKVLSVHDYIVLHTIYDEEYRKNNGYDCLVDGCTLCYGYSMLFMDVMNRLGIPCQIVIARDVGDGSGHAWNVVQVEGQWYHVDLTWADPTPDLYGLCLHNHFLKTDQEYKKGRNSHDFPWEALVEVAEEPFSEDDFLQDVSSGIFFVDETHVVYRKEVGTYSAVVSMDLKTRKETILQGAYWAELDLGDGLYIYPTYGLSYWNGRVYFNQVDKVLSMLPDGSDLQEVYTYEVVDRYITGMMVDQGILYLTLADQDGQLERTEVKLEDAHTHSYEKKIVPATCQEEGYRHMACQCGVSYNRTPIPKIDHVMTTTMEKAPTTEARGEIRRCCLFCQYQEREYPPALPAPEKSENTGICWWIPAAGAGVLVVLGTVLIVGKKRRKVTES